MTVGERALRGDPFFRPAFPFRTPPDASCGLGESISSEPNVPNVIGCIVMMSDNVFLFIFFLENVHGMFRDEEI